MQRIEFHPRLSLQPDGSKQRICALRWQGTGRTHPCDAQRRTPWRLRLGVHEAQQLLGLREIEPAALERMARKLAHCSGERPWGPGRTRAWQALHQRRHARCVPVALGHPPS